MLSFDTLAGSKQFVNEAYGELRDSVEATLRKFIFAAAAAALSLSATANAAPLVLSPTVVTSVTPPASGTFGNSFNPTLTTPITLGLFTDNFVIDLTNSSLTNGSLISVSLGSANNIDFTCSACSVRLDSMLFTLVSGWRARRVHAQPDAARSRPAHLSVTGNIVSGPSASYRRHHQFQHAASARTRHLGDDAARLRWDWPHRCAAAAGRRPSLRSPDTSRSTGTEGRRRFRRRPFSCATLV